MMICLLVFVILLTSSNLAEAFSVRNESCEFIDFYIIQNQVPYYAGLQFNFLLRNSLTVGSESTLHELRVKGCDQEPCTIKKGEALPFELDFSFSTPTKSSNVYFNVFIPKYAVPPAVHGSSLITATCENGNLGFDCPISANTKYTLKSQLIIDSEAVCTSNCENIGSNGTVKIIRKSFCHFNMSYL